MKIHLSTVLCLYIILLVTGLVSAVSKCYACQGACLKPMPVKCVARPDNTDIEQLVERNEEERVKEAETRASAKNVTARGSPKADEMKCLTGFKIMSGVKIWWLGCGSNCGIKQVQSLGPGYECKTCDSNYCNLTSRINSIGWISLLIFVCCVGVGLIT